MFVIKGLAEHSYSKADQLRVKEVDLQFCLGEYVFIDGKLLDSKERDRLLSGQSLHLFKENRLMRPSPNGQTWMVLAAESQRFAVALDQFQERVVSSEKAAQGLKAEFALYETLRVDVPNINVPWRGVRGPENYDVDVLFGFYLRTYLREDWKGYGTEHISPKALLVVSWQIPADRAEDYLTVNVHQRMQSRGFIIENYSGSIWSVFAA